MLQVNVSRVGKTGYVIKCIRKYYGADINV